MRIPLSFLSFLGCLVLSPMSLAEDSLPEHPVWPGAVPGESSYTPPTEFSPDRNDGVQRIQLVEKPTYTVYKAEKPNGAAVIVCPGGGYNILAYDLEGTEIAEWFNSFGVTAVLLKYRVPRRDQAAPHSAPLQDLQRTIRLTRKNADEWGIDPKRIGVLGFSAGGNLSVMAACHFATDSYSASDDVDKVSARPDFLIPIYPAYLGDKKTGKLNPLVKVTKETPPTFIAITQDDADRAVYAAMFFVALKKAGVVSELHIYSKGGHGYGLRPSANPVSTWHKRCEEWMRVSGLCGAVEKK